jgi:hypothetical protein
MRVTTSVSAAAMAICLICAISFGSRPAALAFAPAGTGTVSGKVVNDAGKPVEAAEASVYIVGADRKIKTLAKAKSDKAGAFKIADVPAGKDYRVWVSIQVPNGPMLMGEVRDQTVDHDKNTDVGTVKIRPATM